MTHFPIHNLPYGVFSSAETPPRVCTALGTDVVDLALLEAHGWFTAVLGRDTTLFAQSSLNAFMATGKPTWQAVRDILQQRLSTDDPRLPDGARHPISAVTLHQPFQIGDYTDFYASRQHATNVGSMFRGPDNALLDNWLHLPVGYHGRASSIVLSGTPIRRPLGQTKAPDEPSPRFGPTRELDFELELGFVVGTGNDLGRGIDIAHAHEHLFGMVLVNDWSARDIQRWEYRPLGPFLAKNFATSISPWVVTMDALEPFRIAGTPQNPAPLPYLQSDRPAHYDIGLEVALQTAEMDAPVIISRSNSRHLYWSASQMLTHHSVTGCNLRPGDLLASGTISGDSAESRGSFLELAWRATDPVQLPNGQTRSFLEDGDTLTLRAVAQNDDLQIGFGDVVGTILPAISAEM